MEAKALRLKESGFTLVEVVIFSSILIAMAFVLQPYIQQPRILRQSVALGEYQQNALHAMDIVINDVREAYPSLIPWDTIVPESGAPLDSITLKKANYASGSFDPTDFNTIDIRYDAATRALVRTETFADVTLAPQVTTLFDNLEPPNAEYPLFQKDAQVGVYHVIIVTLRYAPPGLAMQRLLRRIAAKG